MSLRNCERCGRLFSGTELICPQCREDERAEFDKVREYLSRHRGATVAEVSSATGVGVQRIQRWAREGRLQVTPEQLGSTLRCERCGEPIDAGRFCGRCLGELALEIRRASGEPTGSGPSSRSGEAARPPAGPQGRRPARVHVINQVRRRRGR